MFSTISPVSRSQKRAVTAATWGLTSTRGWRQKGWPAGNGSAAKTSSAVPRRREASRRSSRAVSSNNVPRDTFTTMASCGSRSSTARLTAPRVSAVCGAAITKQSLSAASRGRSSRPPTQRTPVGPPRAGRRRTPATLIPRATPRRAIAPPMPPRPNTPSRNSPNSRTGTSKPAKSAHARLRPLRPAPHALSRPRRRAPPPPPRACQDHAMAPARLLRPTPTKRPRHPGSAAPQRGGCTRHGAATRDRPRAAGGASLARGHGPYAGLMEQRQHDLVVQPLGPAQREVDHEVHVLATARLPLDLESRPADNRLQLVQDGGAGV